MTTTPTAGPPVASRQPGRPRDYAAEIDAAIDAVLDAAGPVTVRADPPVARRLTFTTADGPTADGGDWLPFRAGVGELSAAGQMLQVGLGPAAELTAEPARRAPRGPRRAPPRGGAPPPGPARPPRPRT